MSSSSSSSSPATDGGNTATPKLPLREIPGRHGFPILGAIKDRFDYFYHQGQDEFFLSRMKKYNSTVFRTNMPPGPFISSNSKVIAVLDSSSFSVLFDNSKVDKTNVLDGTYFPSWTLTGGHRVCAYLDPSEPQHNLLKSYFLSFLASKHDQFIPIFRASVSNLFINLEDQLSSDGSANFNDTNDKMAFDFVFQLFCDRDPSTTCLRSSEGQKLFNLWLLFQLGPLMSLGLKYVPNIIEDLVLHVLPLPPFLVKPKYKLLYDAFSDAGAKFLDGAVKHGIERDEACHNLVFIAGFNAYGGMKATFPVIIKWVGVGGESLHQRLRDEIRSVIKSDGGVTFSSIEKMSLVKSVVSEALRIEPPVPFQYGRAKHDMVIQNHESAFAVKKDEMIFGYQPLATKDPKVFEDPEVFVADRFVGEEGEKLLKYVFWSNGRETEDPTADNKMCPGKDLVVLMCRLMLVEFFSRYDTFEIECGKTPLGSSVTVKSLTKATWS